MTGSAVLWWLKHFYSKRENSKALVLASLSFKRLCATMRNNVTVYTLSAKQRSYSVKYTVKFRYHEVYGTFFYKFKPPEVQINLHVG